MQRACLGWWGVGISGSVAQQEELGMWSAENYHVSDRRE